MSSGSEQAINIILLGDPTVGKTSLVNRFVNATFSETTRSTAGPADDVRYEAKEKRIVLKDNSAVRLYIWDTAGQERYHTLNRDYYMKADGAVLVYDVCAEDTFKNIRLWSQELGKFGNSNVIVAVAGNKKDMKVSRTVTSTDAEETCKSICNIFKETSAKSGDDVSNVFTELAEAILEMNSREMNGGGSGGSANGCCVVQ